MLLPRHTSQLLEKKKKLFVWNLQTQACIPRLFASACQEPGAPRDPRHPETPSVPQGGQRPPGGSGLQPSAAPGAPGPAPASLGWMEGEKDAGLTGVLLLH